MSFPFTQADYDYIDEKIRNREEFKVVKKRNKVPGKNNVWIDFTVKGWKLDEDTWKRNGIWSEPYLLSFDDFMYGSGLLGPCGGGTPIDVKWVLPTCQKVIEREVKGYGFEPEDEQMRWF